jgi:hypothetical protein
MIHNYWSCSKFADWLRGTPKIPAGTAEEWKSWRKAAKAKKVRYWLAEEGLDFLQDLIYSPINFINYLRHYLDNRWISKTHALTSNLKRGKYYDLDTRLLHALFDELVNFVEIEQAWLSMVCADESSKYQIPWYHKLKLSNWRCPEAGLDYLEWAAQLKYDQDSTNREDPKFGEPTSQAIAAKQTIMLYKWWKEERPKRPDPMAASGWNEHFEKRRNASQDDDFSLSSDDNEASKILEICRKMEQEQEDEDTEMLVRLVKLRSHLWN